MIQGLKSTNRQRVIVEDYVVRGKETNSHCPISSKQWACPNDTIDVNRFMNEELINGNADVLEYIRTRPKTGNLQRSVHDGPTVNEFGIPLDIIMEVNPGDLRTKGQKLKSIAPALTGVGGRHTKKGAVKTKLPQCFKKDAVDVMTALGIDPKQRKEQKQKMQRLKDKTELMVDGSDKTLGIRKEAIDNKAIKTIKERIDLLQKAIISYRKDPKNVDIKRFLKENTEIINRAIVNISKEAKGKDIAKEILKEHAELLQVAHIAIRTHKKQQHKVKVGEQKRRVNIGSQICKTDKDAKNRDLRECFKANRDVVLMNEFLTCADIVVPKPHEFNVPLGAMKP